MLSGENPELALCVLTHMIDQTQNQPPAPSNMTERTSQPRTGMGQMRAMWKKWKLVAGALVLTLLVAGVGVGFYLSQQTQYIEPRASTDTCNWCAGESQCQASGFNNGRQDSSCSTGFCCDPKATTTGDNSGGSTGGSTGGVTTKCNSDAVTAQACRNQNFGHDAGICVCTKTQGSNCACVPKQTLPNGSSCTANANCQSSFCEKASGSAAGKCADKPTSGSAGSTGGVGDSGSTGGGDGAGSSGGASGTGGTTTAACYYFIDASKCISGTTDKCSKIAAKDKFTTIDQCTTAFNQANQAGGAAGGGSGSTSNGTFVGYTQNNCGYEGTVEVKSPLTNNIKLSDVVSCSASQRPAIYKQSEDTFIITCATDSSCSSGSTATACFRISDNACTAVTSAATCAALKASGTTTYTTQTACAFALSNTGSGDSTGGSAGGPGSVPGGSTSDPVAIGGTAQCTTVSSTTTTPTKTLDQVSVGQLYAPASSPVSCKLSNGTNGKLCNCAPNDLCVPIGGNQMCTGLESSSGTQYSFAQKCFIGVSGFACQRRAANESIATGGTGTACELGQRTACGQDGCAAGQQRLCDGTKLGTCVITDACSFQSTDRNNGQISQGQSCVGLKRVSAGEPGNGGFVGCSGSANCFCTQPGIATGQTYTSGTVVCYPDTFNDSCGAPGGPGGPGAPAASPTATTPPTNPPTTTPPTTGPQCLAISISKQNPSLNEQVNFTCATVQGVGKYAFRIKKPNGTISNLGTLPTQPNKSADVTIDQPGQYRVECTICPNGVCHQFETLKQISN